MEKREADYSGVPTSQLSKLMRQRGVVSHKEFAIINDFDERAIARIVYNESPWTNLDLADRICIALGHPGFLQLLTVIPSGYAHAATKMAEDEFYAKDIEASPAQIKKRANELRRLRNTFIKADSAPRAKKKKVLDK